MTIIGFGHVKQTGKDTAAKVLVEEFGFEQISFAGKMKEAALSLDPLISQDPELRLSTIVQCHGWEFAKKEFSEVRRTLQRMGTEVGRHIFGEDFWVEQTLKELDYDKRYVVSDVRFPNEAWAIKNARDRTGVVIRIDRPGYEASGHISETALADFKHWDYILHNNGTRAEFIDKVHELMNETWLHRIHMPPRKLGEHIAPIGNH